MLSYDCFYDRVNRLAHVMETLCVLQGRHQTLYVVRKNNENELLATCAVVYNPKFRDFISKVASVCIFFIIY